MCLIFGLKITEICIQHQGGYVTYMYNDKNIFHVIAKNFVGIAPFIVGCSLFYSLAIFLGHAGVRLIPVAIKMPSDFFDATGIFLNIGIAAIQNIGNICSFSNFTHPFFYLYIFISFFAGTFMSPSVSDIKISMQGFIVIMLYFCMINTVLFVLGISIFDYMAKAISLSSQSISIVVFIIILNVIPVIVLTIYGRVFRQRN